MSITEKETTQEHDGWTDAARDQVLQNLAEFVVHVQTAVAAGTFHAAIFTMIKDADEKDADGNPLARICGYRHGFMEATDVLMQDTVERYEAFKLLHNEVQGDGHAH